MKNVLFLTLLIGCSVVAFAQQQKEPLHGQLGLNGGFCFNPNWSINSSLKQSNIPTINPLSYYFGINSDFSYKSLFFFTEIGVARSENKQNNISNKYRSVMSSFSVGYRVINRPDYNLKIGGSIINSPTTLNIYNNNSSVDLSNIGISNSGRTELTLNPISVGVITRLELFSKSSLPVGLVFSYSQNVANNVWRNPNGSIQNSVRETGSLFSIKVVFTMKTW